MYIDQILYPVEALGPGKRVGIWLIGCNRGCPGCSNPELWSIAGKTNVPVSGVLQVIQDLCRSERVDGFTISGGEPMLQAEELGLLLQNLSQINKDILLFSGFTFEEIDSTPVMSEVLESVAVLVDGPYLQEQNNQTPLRGSSNQRILLFEPALEKKYCEYLEQEQSVIQNLHFPDETISIGIHNRDFSEDINNNLYQRGVRSINHG